MWKQCCDIDAAITQLLHLSAFTWSPVRRHIFLVVYHVFASASKICTVGVLNLHFCHRCTIRVVAHELKITKTRFSLTIQAQYQQEYRHHYRFSPSITSDIVRHNSYGRWVMTSILTMSRKTLRLALRFLAWRGGCQLASAARFSHTP